LETKNTSEILISFRLFNKCTLVVVDSYTLTETLDLLDVVVT